MRPAGVIRPVAPTFPAQTAVKAMPKINPWVCYGGGLLAGLLAYIIFDGSFLATIGGTAAWFTFYTFSAAMRHGGKSDDGKTSARQAFDETELSRQQRRATDRRTSKDRRDD